MNYETTVDARSEGREADDMLAEVEEQERASRKRKLVVAAAIVAVAALLAFLMFHHGGEEAPFAEGGANQVPTVTVSSPGKNTIEGVIDATGTLAARRPMPIGVVGDGGRVISVPVESGQWVRAGQVLAVIDRAVQTEQAASAAANIDVAKADAELAQANLDRALKLVDRGFISKADVDRLTSTRDAAVARVKVAQAQYRELVARNDRLNIVAPAAGLLLERNVEPGQVVSPGSGVLFSVAKGGEMELLARLNEDDLAKVSVGNGATVTPVGTGKEFTGQIWQVSPVIDQDSREGTARIALSYARELRPGGFASAKINAGATVAPRLPESAILSDDKGSYVYIVGKDNKVQRRPVTTGIVTDQGIAITGGLNGTERVVLRAGGFLNEGDTVRPVAEGTAEGSAQAQASAKP